MRFYKKEIGTPLVKLEQIEPGCWINIYPPFDNDSLQKLSEQLDIPFDFLIDSLDIDERSRYEQEDGVQLIVINIPVENKERQDFDAIYITIPIGIIEVDNYIITISKYENEVIDFFLKRNVRQLSTSNHSQFVLLLFDRTVYFFLHYLKVINNQRNRYEKELYHSSRNEELSNLMNLQKSLVYFLTTLRDNSIMMLRIQRTDFLNIHDNEEDADFFEDIIIDMEQAQEMAQIYTEILNGTMDAFASIISNNLNTIMKRLTLITIILMVPTLVASFYGMNVNLPFQDRQEDFLAFFLIILISGILSIALMILFFRKRLF